MKPRENVCVEYPCNNTKFLLQWFFYIWWWLSSWKLWIPPLSTCCVKPYCYFYPLIYYNTCLSVYVSGRETPRDSDLSCICVCTFQRVISCLLHGCNQMIVRYWFYTSGKIGICESWKNVLAVCYSRGRSSLEIHLNCLEMAPRCVESLTSDHGAFLLLGVQKPKH